MKALAIFGAALMTVGTVQAAGEGTTWDQLVDEETKYWVGDGGDVTRYFVMCGWFRKVADMPRPVLIYPESTSNQGKVTGTPVEAAVPMDIYSNDLSYPFALAAARGCAEIPALIIEATAGVITDQATAESLEAGTFVGGVTGSTVNIDKGGE